MSDVAGESGLGLRDSRRPLIRRGSGKLAASRRGTTSRSRDENTRYVTKMVYKLRVIYDGGSEGPAYVFFTPNIW